MSDIMVTALTIKSSVHINDTVLFQELQGEAALLDLKTGIYFSLDTVGTRIGNF